MRAPTPAIVDSKDGATAPVSPVIVETTTDKSRELRRGREEETEGGECESAPKRRKITPPPPSHSLPPPMPVPLPTPPSPAAAPTPVSEVIPTPEVAEVAQMGANEVEKTVVVVSADKDSASADVSSSDHQLLQSGPSPKSEFTTSEPDLKPQPAQEEKTKDLDPPEAAEADDDDDIVSAPRKIGIQHILLVYETIEETLQCRMCLYGALFFVHHDWK